MAQLISAEFGAGDAVMLSEISEDAFVSNLELRYNKDKIYTYIGEVCVAVNPYRDLGLYLPDKMVPYLDKPMYMNEPHIYALANTAYTTMRRTGNDVVVVISGESGAGKTEASKQVMRFVASAKPNSQAATEQIKNQLLASNPILEAFGNAKTTRNDNSSRFGKYMDIHFDYKQDPVGGHIYNYLLEKARVVKQSDGERNFHIFYQILAGCSDAQLAELRLQRDPYSYLYLKQGGAGVSGVDDKKEYADVIKAMDDIGLDKETQDDLHKFVAAVVHLGRVEFDAAGEGCKVRDTAPLADVAPLLGGKVEDFTKALTVRVVAAGGKVYEKPLAAPDAYHARDALAKSLYDRLFTFLVDKVNKSISADAPVGGESRHTVMGVLDIYGFEIFASNGFEQFCINYCNEKLQQLFIELVLKREQEEYKREGIDWVNIDYFDNAAICTMVDDSKTGIISMLDEQCAGKTGSDAKFLAHMDKALRGNDRYASRQTAGSDNSLEHNRDFRICHFAGDVVYNTEGFVDKNQDTLFHDLKRLLYNCNNKSLQSMWPEGADEITAVHKIPPTAATSFRASMFKLVEILLSKEPYYVRCIKPNASKAAGKWTDELCRHQVRYLGLMENLRVRRAGYCNRQVYDVFLERYKMLSDKTWPNWRKDPQEGVRHIVEALKMGDQVAFGKTKLFIKEPKTLVDLEDARERMLPVLATKIQAYWRGVLARRRVEKLRAIYTIIACFHMWQFRTYWGKVCQLFKNVKTMRDRGKALQWPTAPVGLGDFVKYCKKIHLTWRCAQVLKQYDEEATVDLKRKVGAQDLLGGRREFWGYQCRWEGNYMTKQPLAVREKYGAQLATLMEKTGDKKVFFSSFVNKLNTKGKDDARVLVVTDNNLYKLDAKSFKIHKTPVPLADVTGFAVSTGEDQAVVIHLSSETDLVVTLRGDANAVELVALISEAAAVKFPVEVDNQIIYKIKGAEKNISFEEADEAKATRMTKRNSGFALVTRKASIMRRRGEAPASDAGQ